MNYKYTLLLLLLTLHFTTAFSQQAFIISGHIYDSATRQPLPGATVRIKNTETGTNAKEDGSFSFQCNTKLPFTLIVSSIGFKEQEFSITDQSGTALSISLNPTQQMIASSVVVTASRRAESFLKSPVSIEKLDIKAIKETTAPSFFDALENIKGVQMTTLSLTYKVPNTRGFSGTTNSRFLQLVDGVDNISPGIGAPVGNTIGPSDIDVESVELIPGAASALYGLNAVNGIANIKTKSPYKYEGLSILQRTGLNHLNNPDQDPALLTETAFRFAKVVNKRWAIKINGDFNQGWDGVANNLRDQNPNANTSVGLTGTDNPGKDLINVYGDESSDRKTLSLNGKNYVVSRTGYAEKDLADYHLKNWKGDAGIYYRFGNDNELSYVFRSGEVSNLYQRGNRIQLNGLTIRQHAVELKNRRLTLRAYYTEEHTGDSYNLRPLGENLDLSFKDNTTWFNDYRNAYLRAISQGSADAAAHAAARAFADNGRLQSGTDAFNAKKEELIRINNWDKGAALIMNTAFAHAEGQYDLSHLTRGVQTLIGFNYRDYIIHPDGNSYVNPESINDAGKSDDPFRYYSYGGYVQLMKTLFDERLKIVGSLRLDKVQYFEPRLNPRIAAVYTAWKRHNFRASFQNGFRFPTLFEGFSYVDNGGIKRLGGLPVLASNFGVFENSYVRASQDDFIAAVNNDINRNGLSQSAAILKNKAILKRSNYDYIRPEHINSFEVGYRGTFLQDKLFIDADYYFNAYRDFIGQVELTKPNAGFIGIDDSTVFAAYDKTKSKVYRMWTNSTSLVTNQGASLGLSYTFCRKFSISGNVSYASLVQVSEADALIPAFNTPQWTTNISIGNSSLTPRLGCNLSYRWQSQFDWQSPLANGTIPAYGTLGAQVTYRLPKVFTTLKAGSSNLLNKRYYQYEGGPVNDGLYYLTILFDNPLSKK
jgi:outer membrane receptor protein involved in Fe transport